MSGDGEGDVTMLSKQYRVVSSVSLFVGMTWEVIPLRHRIGRSQHLTILLYHCFSGASCPPVACVSKMDSTSAAHQPRLQPITHTTTHILSLDNLCQTDCLL